MQNEITFKLLKGREIPPYIDEVAKFRMQNFKEFPYLYAGDDAYEKEYLQSYVNDPKAILLTGFNANNEIIAISTGIPVISNADLLAVAKDLFIANHLNPAHYFYIGETIIHASYRNKGLYSKIVALREQAARDLGFDNICFLSVVREANHPQQPANYRSPEAIFNHCGYKKSNMIIHYHWPTIQADNTIVNQEHALTFWLKKFAG